MKLAEVHMVRGLKEYISSMCDLKNDAKAEYLISSSTLDTLWYCAHLFPLGQRNNLRKEKVRAH